MTVRRRNHQMFQAPRVRSALKLYAECMGCTNTPTQCPGIWKDIRGGVPPRGFHFENVPVKLLVVAKNPGHPLPGEKARLKGCRGMPLLNAYRRFLVRYYANPGRIGGASARYHKNLFRYLSFLLDVPEGEIQKHAAHTNLVKCSTRKERARLKSRTIEECFRKYFVAELKILRPKVLLALGREVERFLKSKREVHGLPVLHIKHPTYPYPRTDEAAILKRIREQIHKHLNRPDAV